MIAHNSFYIWGGLLRKSLIYKYNIEIEDKEEYER